MTDNDPAYAEEVTRIFKFLFNVLREHADGTNPLQIVEACTQLAAVTIATTPDPVDRMEMMLGVHNLLNTFVEFWIDKAQDVEPGYAAELAKAAALRARPEGTG